MFKIFIHFRGGTDLGSCASGFGVCCQGTDLDLICIKLTNFMKHSISIEIQYFNFSILFVILKFIFSVTGSSSNGGNKSVYWINKFHTFKW